MRAMTTALTATWADAHTAARTAATPLAARTTPARSAIGLMVTEPVLAATASPRADIAAMDGYAVAGPGPWRPVGRRLAGDPGEQPGLAAGEAVEIGTGAPVPGGTEAVLPYEDSRLDDGLVAGSPARPHIRYAGENGRPGEEIFPAGRRLTAVGAATMTQFGVDEVTAVPRPRVTLLVTGNEVVMHGTPGPGQVRDSFSPLVTAVAESAGAEVTRARHVRDDPDALRAALAVADADIVVVSGASSAGAADHLHGVLGALGADWLVDTVECRPGHPQGLAVLPGGRWVVSLPGNPYAGLVAALTLLGPIAAALAGDPRPAPARAVVTGTAKTHPTAVRVVPVELLAHATARIVPGARPASLRAAATADALAVLPPSWKDGDPAPLLPLFPRLPR
jgi:molybdopterin molybdotransferase